MMDWVTGLLKDYIGDNDANCLLRRHVYANQNQEREPIYREILKCMAKVANASEPAIKLDKRQRTPEERQFFFRRMFAWVLVRVYEDYKDIEPYREYRIKFSEMLNEVLTKRNDEEKKIRTKLKKSKRTIKEFLQVYSWIGPKESEPNFDKLSEKEKANMIADYPNAVNFSKVNTDYLNQQLLINEYNNGSEFVKYEPVFSEKLSQVARNYVYALFLCDVERLFFQDINAGETMQTNMVWDGSDDGLIKLYTFLIENDYISKIDFEIFSLHFEGKPQPTKINWLKSIFPLFRLFYALRDYIVYDFYQDDQYYCKTRYLVDHFKFKGEDKSEDSLYQAKSRGKGSESYWDKEFSIISARLAQGS